MRLPKFTALASLNGLKKAGALLILSCLIVASLGRPYSQADQFDQQIQALRAQSSAAQGVLNGLESQAASYQDTINQLQAQINTIQAQIAANQAKQTDLENQIAKAEADLAREKGYLGQDLKTMYIDGQMSTIEELATSNSLSEYVDKEEYRQSVQTNIQTTLKHIADLEAQLKLQKTEVETLIASEQTQNGQLSAIQAQQAQLLAYNQDQQNAYNAQIASNSSQIAELRREQIIANERYNIGNFSSNGNGGYPSVWADSAKDSMIDDWGMYNRECVSYTAFKVHQDFLAGRDSHDMPWWGGEGNANQWPGDAEAAGIPVDSNPTPGSIAIYSGGTWGHAMYVEAVNGNEIYIQQFNVDYTGHYSEGWRYATGLVFIHF